MPSVSKKQHNFMAAVAHSPSFAKKAGVPQSVGQDFTKADKGRTFSKGGNTMATKLDPRVAKMIAAKTAASRPGMAAPSRPNPMSALAVKAATSHPDMAAPSRPDSMSSLAAKAATSRPGMAGGMKKGGATKKMAGGGLAAGHKSADGIASKGKTVAKNIEMKKGGKC
jgi:hypothetical protein